ncbi:MAG: DUF2800 domain-containing protein [Anaeroplasma sp.]
MPSQHARLSASAAKAWLSCSGYIAFQDHFNNPSAEESEYAKEGTMAHELAEKKLNHIFFNGPSVKRTKDNADMLYYVEQYVDYVVELHSDLVRKYGPSNVDIRIEQKLDFSNIVPEGFGTGDVVILTPDELHIVDLKYGQGVIVSANDNAQLKLYGLGAINQYDELYDIKKVVLHIAQVRVDYGFSSFEIDRNELEKWSTEVKDAADKIFSGAVSYQPGEEQCRWCEGRPMCKKRWELLFEPLKKIINERSEEL